MTKMYLFFAAFSLFWRLNTKRYFRLPEKIILNTSVFSNLFSYRTYIWYDKKKVKKKKNTTKGIISVFVNNHNVTNILTLMTSNRHSDQLVLSWNLCHNITYLHFIKCIWKHKINIILRINCKKTFIYVFINCRQQKWLFDYKNIRVFRKPISNSPPPPMVL